MTALMETSMLGTVSAAASTFGLIFMAEMGDETQLVCMTLAARHRHWPVLAGAVSAFVVLNTLAVAFGAALAEWIPERVLAGAVAVFFALFAILALRSADETEDREVEERDTRAVFTTAFFMILLAEMGDKTQLAVAGLATNLPIASVWIGGTLGLSAASAAGVILGRRLLRKISRRRLQQASGVFFLILAVFALSKAF
jgi:putative Ca2+/H+ antiporter (TMEM165/GDT1 family)